ncbi:Importin-9 [Myotis brandtii]|uniref:Importin-9 n=1 Tax=Myotis brandtii TaxID=109478 RepID=S7NRQ3_MYOBR|nr:Importin-9 [Myotis brandtii]
MWEDEEEDQEDEEEGGGLAGQLLSDILACVAYLTDFLCQFAQQPCYVVFSGHLSDSERRVLQAIGI